MKKTIRVLTACLILILSAGTLRAQSYTPVPYNLGGVFEVTDDTVPIGQKATDLSMDCLAANGYGQWTASYKTQNAFDSGSPGLFLLANALRTPSTYTATGIVSFRPFNYFDTSGYPVSVVKNATNLKGRVRYVWPSADHKTFVVEGFDECPPNGTPAGLAGINLEFASYPYNATYGAGNQHLGKDVIKASSPMGSYIVSVPVFAHPIVTAANEPDPQDWYSIAMDTTNLYIVYEEYDSTGHFNIWEMTESLDNGTLSAPIEVAAGARRPTIYADVRRALHDTVTYACFDVAYFTGTFGADHLTWYNYDGSRFPHPADTTVMTKNCQDTAGGTWMYKKILHAQMLDATWEGIASSDTTPRAIYAIVTDMMNNNHLILFKIKGGVQDANAYYCDGYNIYNHSAGVNDGKFPVIDKPIRAFVNPYDGEKDDNFDEYHCMYQLARTYSGGSHRPLMMIHGAMVHDTLGPRVCLNYAGVLVTPGTVTNRPDIFHAFYADPGLNTDGGDTDNYVGAVNQMGIHTHWRNGTQHYYLRDTRNFDENIEENTLATEDVYIADGTSHGGNYTPTVQPGKTMTLWTDRAVPYDGLPGNCTAFFPSTGTNYASVNLVVGTDTGSPAKIAAVWNADIYADTSSQLLEINPNSSMNVYATMNCNIGLKMIGKGATMTGGTYSYPSSISSPAYLNLHGGSAFGSSTISADSSIITCEFDQNFYNLDSSISYSTLDIPAACSITNSIISNMDSTLPGSDSNSLEILGNSNWQNATDTVTFLNTLFNYGSISVGIDGPPYPSLPITITGGKFNNSPIVGNFGPNISTIQDVLFDLTSVLIHAPAIFLQNFSDSTEEPFQTYNPITISGCDFGELPDSVDAIYASGYATDSDVMQNLSITGNTFNDADYTGLLPHAAIELQNSEGLIADNTIEGNFQYGIYVSGPNTFITHQRTKSTICTNTIRAGTIAGLYTDWTEGYAELNNIKVKGVGHITGVEDAAKILYSNYSANMGSGIDITDTTRNGLTDLTGVHSIAPDSIDNAAFDTISMNGGVAQISILKGAHVALGNNTELWAWTDWCRNNIVTNYSDDYCACLGGGGGVSYVPLIVEDSGHSMSQLGNISHNYFGDTTGGTILPENQPTMTGCNDTLDRGTPSSWLTSDTLPVAAMGFCYDADSNFTTWQNRPSGPIDCGAALPEYKAGKKAAKTLSIQTIDTSTCQYKYSLGDAEVTAGEYQQAVNELQWYIETCYDSGAAQGFGDLGEAEGNAYPTPAGQANFRDWLKTVLWLGPMYPNWYCNCAQDIYYTYVSIDAGRNLNAALAVLRYLDSSGRCDWDADESTYLAERHQVWLDTVKSLHKGDTTDFPEDTTLPSIDELGLGILRGPPAGVQNVPPSPTGISDLTASENPFTKETTISFETGEYAYISFQVFDVLGKVVVGDYKGSVLPPGSYSFNIDGANLPNGTYYARITTPLGETRMIKLVKE